MDPCDLSCFYIEFPSDEREKYTLTTDTSYASYRRNILFVDRDHLMFRVQADSDAFLELSSVPGVYTSDTYRVIIGADNNQKSQIRTSPIGNLLVESVCI